MSTDKNLSSRVVVRHGDRRQLAFALARQQKARFPEWNWHVGLSFNTHVALDLQNPISEELASFIGQWLADELRDKVGLFKTPNGYWVVNETALFVLERWRDVYEKATLKFSENGLDMIHAHLSLKYNKTTLRISPKNGETHRLVEVIEPERHR